MKTKKELVVDAIFLIALTLVFTGLIINIAVSGKSAEATCEPTTQATTAETTEYITEHIPTETPTEVTTEPAVYDVPLDEDLQLHIIRECEEHSIDPAIIVAMAFRESTYRTDAVGDGGRSLGLCQVQPRWHSERMERLNCPNLLDPYQNVTVAVDYLCELLNRYGSMDKALTAYNRGSYSGTITQYARDVLAKAEELAVIA